MVHEAYLRLVDARGGPERWDSRGHFFAAAAEAMRRILVDNARRKRAEKRGGRLAAPGRSTTSTSRPRAPSEDLLALDEALTQLEAKDPVKAQLVKLRYFAGLTRGRGRAGAGHLAAQPPTATGVTPGSGCSTSWGETRSRKKTAEKPTGP